MQYIYYHLIQGFILVQCTVLILYVETIKINFVIIILLILLFCVVYIWLTCGMYCHCHCFIRNEHKKPLFQVSYIRRSSDKREYKVAII